MSYLFTHPDFGSIEKVEIRAYEVRLVFTLDDHESAKRCAEKLVKQLQKGVIKITASWRNK